MRTVSKSACNCVASYVDPRAAYSVRRVETDVSSAVICTRDRRGGKIVIQLITLEQLIDDLKTQDIELDEAFIDINDVVQIPEVEGEN